MFSSDKTSIYCTLETKIMDHFLLHVGMFHNTCLGHIYILDGETSVCCQEKAYDCPRNLFRLRNRSFASLFLSCLRSEQHVSVSHILHVGTVRTGCVSAAGTLTSTTCLSGSL